MTELVHDDDDSAALTQALALCAPEDPVRFREAWARARDCADAPQALTRALLNLACAPEGAQALRQPHGLARLGRLLGQGDYPRRALTAQPQLAAEVLDALHVQERTAAQRVDALRQELRAVYGERPTRAEVMRCLRHMKRRETLALYLLEVEGERGIRATTAGISRVAQACLQVALEQAARLCRALELLDQICVIGMGKLGGEELNYSSDVDLIVLCSDVLFTSHESRARAEEVVRLMIALMEEATADGYVFRVDLRLRPEGARGLLVQCPDAMLDYYLSWGRTWERSAFLRARAVAGALEMGERLLGALEPFLYKRHLDYKVLDDLRAMKELVHRNAQLAASGQEEDRPGRALGGVAVDGAAARR